MSLSLRGFGVAVVCGRCGDAVHTVHAATVREARVGRGLCPDCYAETAQGVPLTRVPGIGEVRAAELRRSGITSVGDLAVLSDDRIAALVAKPGSLSVDQMARWRDAARELMV